MKRGFSLIETIIAIAVIAVGLLTIQLGTSIVMNQRQREFDEQLAWYQLLGELESPEYRFRVTKMDPNHRYQLVLKTPRVTERPFILVHRRTVKTKSPHELMLTTPDGGYLPLIRDVKDVTWTTKQNRLYLELTMMKGQKFSALTSVPVSLDQEKDEKK
ncbi:prepilin-type N-terminal cleavage/methylation domain-containing protein [Secundilactobacillus muriivasis]